MPWPNGTRTTGEIITTTAWNEVVAALSTWGGNVDGGGYTLNNAVIPLDSSDLSDGADLVKGPASAVDGGVALFDGTTGKLLKDAATVLSNSTWRLDIGGTGSGGSLRVWDQTPTTGSTLMTIRAGAGQSGNMWEILDSGGTATMYANSGGGLKFNQWVSDINNKVSVESSTGLNLGSDRGVRFTSSASYDSPDTAIYRPSAGVIEINNGTAGQLRDIKVRSIQVASNTEATPGASYRGQFVLTTGTSGQADTLRVCLKDVDDNYYWVAIV